MAKDPAGRTPAPRKKSTKKPGTPAKKVAGKVVPTRKALATKKPAPEKKAVARRVGAPSLYTPELALAICDHIANCVSLRAIAAMDGMPTVRTIMNWLADDSKPEFMQQYLRAREAQADKMAEDILAIADEQSLTTETDEAGVVEVKFDAVAVQRNRLRVDARKWLASKMAPKKYGDKVQAELTGLDGGAIAVQSTVTFVQPPRRDDEGG